MLTYAIGYIQNVQLVCFALVLWAMVWQDRESRSLRWLAWGYTSGLAGAVITLLAPVLPAWAWFGLVQLAAPAGYTCFHAGFAEFTGRWRPTRWFGVSLTAISLPLFLWASPQQARWDFASTAGDFILAAVTALTAALLLTTRDHETRWARFTMAIFFACYSSVEWARVLVYAWTRHLPADAAPLIENASGIAYIVSCSVLPLAFIWMMNSRLHAGLNRQVLLDPLTGVWNRRGLEQALESELAHRPRTGADWIVVVMDIDRFKQCNDAFGHRAGDAVLQQAASLMKDTIPRQGHIGRYGGDEMVLLLPETVPGGAHRQVEALRAAIAEHPFSGPGRTLRITASFGISSTAGRAAPDRDLLLHEADAALYAAKRAGRNRAESYAPNLENSANVLVQTSGR